VGLGPVGEGGAIVGGIQSAGESDVSSSKSDSSESNGGEFLGNLGRNGWTDPGFCSLRLQWTTLSAGSAGTKQPLLWELASSEI